MQIWPQSHWFGLTRRRLRRLVTGVFIVVPFSFAVLLLLVLAFVHYRAHRASVLLEMIHNQEIGKPAAPELLEMLKRYEYTGPTPEPEQPCTAKPCEFWAHINSLGFSYPGGWNVADEPYLGKVRDALDQEWLNYLGIRFWDVFAGVELADGRAGRVHTEVLVEGPEHRWLHAVWILAPETSEVIKEARELGTPPETWSKPFFAMRHNVHMEPEHGDGVTAYVTSGTTSDERQRLLSINVACFTRLGGCWSLHQLAPEAAKAAVIEEPGVF